MGRRALRPYLGLTMRWSADVLVRSGVASGSGVVKKLRGGEWIRSRCDRGRSRSGGESHSGETPLELAGEDARATVAGMVGFEIA